MRQYEVVFIQMNAYHSQLSNRDKLFSLADFMELFSLEKKLKLKFA